jgi:hypothetical protein
MRNKLNRIDFENYPTFIKTIRTIFIICSIMILSLKVHSQIGERVRFTLNRYYCINDLPDDNDKLLTKNVDFNLKSDSITISVDNIEYYFKRRKFRKNPKSGKPLSFYKSKPLYAKYNYKNYKLIETAKVISLDNEKIICVGQLKTVLGDNIKKENITFEIKLNDLHGIVIGL